VTVTCSPPFDLTRPAFPEMTRVADLPAPRIPGAVLMPLIIDDEFHVFARERCLPPCALSFLMLAGSWSARESRSGFVPNSMLADFSDDFAQAERTLCSARILKRVKAGVRIVEGHGVTVVNARDVTRDAEREEAEAGRKRELERTRKQRQREKDKAERAERMSADVTPMSRGTSTDVPPEKTGKRKKPQVNPSDVPRDIGVTSRGTESPSRVRARQDDFDFDPREGVSQSKSDACASDADDPELVTVVANAICAEASFLPGDDQARAVIRIFEDRARKAGTVIRSKPAYYAKVVANEPDLWNGVLLPKPPPPAAEPGPWVPPVIAVRDPDHHEFDPPYQGAPVCRCGSTKNSPKHYSARAECPA
jgi:hypothetical protein